MVAVPTAVAALALVVAGCATAPPPPAALPPAGPAKTVYLVSHGWHVGLAVRRDDVAAGRWPESADLAGEALEVGWGDADYYPAVRGNPALALRAAFASRGSVLHVAGFDGPVTDVFPGAPVLAVTVSPRGLDALVDFIRSAYARDAAGRPLVVARGIYGDARFYRATGAYRLFENSNTWTARALAAAGCPIDPGQTPTAGGVMHRALAFGRVLRPGRLWDEATVTGAGAEACG